MLWFLAVIGLAIVVSLLRGGRISNFTEIRLRAWWLLFIGFGMQLAAAFLGSGHSDLATALVLLSYLPLMAVVLLNRDEPGMWIAGIGILMNFTVIVINSGMPVLPASIELAGGNPADITLDPKHVLLTAETRLPFLADIIPLPGNVISLGDVFLAVGLGVFIEDQLKQPKRLFRHRVQGVPGSAADR
ncbi:MAG: DUF5317 domain-containing protein [Acidimicrobiia bacterium]